MRIIELESAPESNEVRVGLGRKFVGVPGRWTGDEMERARTTGTMNVPVSEWLPQEGRYRYYMRVPGE